MSNQHKTPLPLKPAQPAAPKTVRKAFTVERAPGGWTFVTLTYTEDDKLVSVERSDPDIKPIILEKLKIAQFKNWTTIG